MLTQSRDEQYRRRCGAFAHNERRHLYEGKYFREIADAPENSSLLGVRAAAIRVPLPGGSENEGTFRIVCKFSANMFYPPFPFRPKKVKSEAVLGSIGF